MLNNQIEAVASRKLNDCPIQNGTGVSRILRNSLKMVAVHRIPDLRKEKPMGDFADLDTLMHRPCDIPQEANSMLRAMGSVGAAHRNIERCADRKAPALDYKPAEIRRAG